MVVFAVSFFLLGKKGKSIPGEFLYSSLLQGRKEKEERGISETSASGLSPFRKRGSLFCLNISLNQTVRGEGKKKREKRTTAFAI